MKLAENRSTVIPFKQKEKTKREEAFYREICGLEEAMDELVLVEKMTGRAGFSERVCLAFSGVLMASMRISKERAGRK